MVKGSFPQREIADACTATSARWTRANACGGGEPVPPEGEEPIQTLHIDPAFERKQIVRLQAVRARRDGEAVEVSLVALREAAASDRNLDGAAARLRPRARQRGEIVEALQAVFGTYTETPASEPDGGADRHR